MPHDRIFRVFFQPLSGITAAEGIRLFQRSFVEKVAEIYVVRFVAAAFFHSLPAVFERFFPERFFLISLRKIIVYPGIGRIDFRRFGKSVQRRVKNAVFQRRISQQRPGLHRSGIQSGSAFGMFCGGGIIPQFKICIGQVDFGDVIAGSQFGGLPIILQRGGIVFSAIENIAEIYQCRQTFGIKFQSPARIFFRRFQIAGFVTGDGQIGQRRQ